MNARCQEISGKILRLSKYYLILFSCADIFLSGEFEVMFWVGTVKVTTLDFVSTKNWGEIY